MTPAKDQALAVLKSHGRSFYFASHLLAPEYRSRAARLYAFCRYVDDVADEAIVPDFAIQELDCIKRSVQSGCSDNPCVIDMIALMQELAMPHAPVLFLIEGIQSDLTMQQIKDETHLLRYAYQVAGTVGLMMCELLDVQQKQAWPFAIDLGIAMQLTNIARDVGQDAGLGRIYLPATWLDSMTAQEILSPSAQQALSLQASTKRLLALANDYYLSGLSGLIYLPPAARYGILVAAHVYSEIGQKVAQSGYRSWDRRAVVSQSRKAVCAASALMRYALHPSLRQSNPRHDSALHQHLQDCFGTDQTR
ncbi:phytoene/squalene synthase family protein [Zwartia sp.]|uniref:phytoene/squalene synthase family protein n=1 Tax=Zwartia sp. TaxID=2978004 RepID=UPI003BB02463